MAEPSVYEQFVSYPFDTDEVFQEGLSSILESVQENDNREDIIGQAKAFYFSSATGRQVSWDEIKAGTATTSPEEQNGREQPSQNEQKILSFAEIMSLIESNQTHLVPNNETIPGGTTEAPPSTSAAEQRKKPWELAAASDEGR